MQYSADQKPMASGHGRPDPEIVQSAAGSEVVFDVNQSGLGTVRQVFQRCDNCRFKYLFKSLILGEFHDNALRNRSTRSTSDRLHVAIWDENRPFSSFK
jgi:hypothetical protein